MAERILKLAEEAEPLGVTVVARCDLQMEGCTAREPAAVTIVRVGVLQDQFVVCRSCLERMIKEGEWSVRGSRVNPRVEFELVDSAGRTVVAVDVKSAPRTRAVSTDRWATSLRRNLAAHGAVPNSRYFLLIVIPEAGYLWSAPGAPPDAVPDYAVDLSELLILGDEIPTGNGRAAEEWVGRFLAALLEGKVSPSGLWWTESGLGRAIENDQLSLVHR